MKSIERFSFVVVLSLWFLFPLLPALGQVSPAPKPFMVFDATLYIGKPDMYAYGIQPITMAYAGSFGSEWHKYADRLPDIESVQAVARGAKQKGYGVVLDIEHWPLEGSADIVRESLRKYMTVLGWFRDAAPGLNLGFYGAPPVHDYWRAITDKRSQEHRAWMAANDQTRPLAGAVDVLFPSLYTFYPDQAGWRKYAIAQVEEARRSGNGNPVYVFLWPQFHESNEAIGGQYLPDDYWLLELETAKQYADGIVIWGGWERDNRPAKWDENAGWWRVTKEFMMTGDQAAPAAPTSLTIR